MAIQDPVKWFRSQTSPVSVAICILMVVGAILGTFAPSFTIENLAFDGHLFPKVWTLFTYPYIGYVTLFLVFGILWIFWIGSAVERDLGSKKFLIVWLFASVVGILPLVFLKEQVIGMVVPGAILVTIWGTRYPNQVVMVFMIIPVSAKWIATAAVLGVFAMYAEGTTHSLNGLAAIAGCIVAFSYARNILPRTTYGKGSMNQRNNPQSRAAKVYKQEYYDEVHRREKEREEKERLRKLFEGSLEDK